MSKKSDYRIYSKEDKRQEFLSLIYWISFIIGLCLLVIYGLIFWDVFSKFSTNHKHWVETATILSSFMSFFAFGALIISFREAQKSTKRSNTLSVCIEIFKELRSEKFLTCESIILRKLPNETSIKRIQDIEDNELRNAIKSYLNIVNNISALVIHNIVDDEPIIAYKGMGILYFYDLLKPYIEISRIVLREENSKTVGISEDVKQIIEKASHLNFAHYELFVQQIKLKSAYLTNEFTVKLK